MNELERYYLGYDAGCGTCSNVAHQIAEVVGDKVQIMSLSSPEMERWRTDAMGENPPWKPTLVAVSRDRAKAWTGLGMAFALRREIGTASMWKVAQLMGAHKDLVRPEVRGFTRGQFMRGTIGAVAGASILMGTGSALAAAKTKDDWAGSVAIRSKKELNRGEIISQLRSQRAKNALTPLRGSAGIEESNAIKRFDALVANHDATPSESEIALGARHQLSDGGEILAVSFQFESDAIIFHQLTHSDGTSKDRLMVFRSDQRDEKTGDPGSVHLLAMSEDGFPTRMVDSNAVAAAISCTSSSQCGSTYCNRCGCDSYNIACLANCCAPCAFSCGVAWTCVGCIGVWCPICIGLNSCCTSSSCKYQPGPNC